MPLLSGAEPTKHYRVVSVFLDRNISTLGYRFPTFHRTRTCFYLTRRSRKGGSQVGDGASGTVSASGGGGPLAETLLTARFLAGFSTITSLNFHNHPGDKCYHDQCPNPLEEETSEPCVALGGRGEGRSGRRTWPYVLGAKPPPITACPERVRGALQTPTSLQGGVQRQVSHLCWTLFSHQQTG